MNKFKTSINGYDKLEVLEFVDTVTREYENLLNKLKLQEEEISNLKKSDNNLNDISKTFEKAVYVAEEASKQIKRNAHSEASLIVEKAKNDASRILNDSLIRSRKVSEDAEELRRKVVIYKRRVKNVIEDQLMMIDDVDNINI